MDKNAILSETIARNGAEGARAKHLSLMLDVLQGLSGQGLIFKGGSSLMFCHGCDRYSEDLDFDSKKSRNLKNVFEKSLSSYKADGYSISIENTKNTTTSNRYMIRLVDSKGESSSLKVDISLREKEDIPTEEINGILTYSKSEIFRQKVRAVSGSENTTGRTKVRDIYDVNYLLSDESLDFDETLLRRLKDDLVSPDDLCDRYELAWSEDPITADFDLEIASLEIFEKLEARLDKVKVLANNPLEAMKHLQGAPQKINTPAPDPALFSSTKTIDRDVEP